MNRIQVGNIEAILKDGSTAFYGIEVPEGMTNEQAAETQEWHGPPVAEMFEDQERTLFPDWRTVTRIFADRWNAPRQELAKHPARQDALSGLSRFAS